MSVVAITRAVKSRARNGRCNPLGTAPAFWRRRSGFRTATREGGQRIRVDPDHLVKLGRVERAALEAAEQEPGHRRARRRLVKEAGLPSVYVRAAPPGGGGQPSPKKGVRRHLAPGQRGRV